MEGLRWDMPVERINELTKEAQENPLAVVNRLIRTNSEVLIDFAEYLIDDVLFKK